MATGRLVLALLHQSLTGLIRQTNLQFYFQFWFIAPSKSVILYAHAKTFLGKKQKIIKSSCFMKRRTFLKNTGLITAGLMLAETSPPASTPASLKNKLPKWKGFNVLDFFSPNPTPSRNPTTEE